MWTHAVSLQTAGSSMQQQQQQPGTVSASTQSSAACSSLGPVQPKQPASVQQPQQSSKTPADTEFMVRRQMLCGKAMPYLCHLGLMTATAAVVMHVQVATR